MNTVLALLLVVLSLFLAAGSWKLMVLTAKKGHFILATILAFAAFLSLAAAWITVGIVITPF